MRVDWLKHGDKNTKFFHKRATQQNSIRGLKDENSEWKISSNDLQTIMVNFFSELFKAGDLQNVNNVCAKIHRKIPPHLATLLTLPFTPTNVWNALQEMVPTKTPGLNGFNALFYQQYWDVVGEDLTSAVLKILNDQRDPTGMNHTYITLIPKLHMFCLPSHFRPISLCNVMMKLSTKCIANRLKNMLPRLIEESQSAFVPGCLIIDNALIAFEILITSNTRKMGGEVLWLSN